LVGILLARGILLVVSVPKIVVNGQLQFNLSSKM